MFMFPLTDTTNFIQYEMVKKNICLQDAIDGVGFSIENGKQKMQKHFPIPK